MTPLDTLDLTLFLAAFTGLCVLAALASALCDMYCWYHGIADAWPGGNDDDDDNGDANSRSVGYDIPLDKR